MTYQGWLGVTKSQWLSYGTFYQQGLVNDLNSKKITEKQFEDILADRDKKLLGSNIGGQKASEYLNSVKPRSPDYRDVLNDPKLGAPPPIIGAVGDAWSKATDKAGEVVGNVSNFIVNGVSIGSYIVLGVLVILVLKFFKK